MRKIFFIAAILSSIVIAFTACSGNDNKAKTEQLAKDEMYTCTMHNQVMSTNPGHCSICGMTMVKQKMTQEQEKMMKEGTYSKSKEEQ